MYSSVLNVGVAWPVLFSAAITLALLVVSAYAFRRLEKSFADLI
jgi:hypothetical protein